MLKHEDLWNAIDVLARINGYSTSGLAKQAGLDPTIFNKSKRINNEGRPRWPTMESITKILNSTNTPIGQFSTIIHNREGNGDAVNIPFNKLNSLQHKKSFISATGQINLNMRDTFFETTEIDSHTFGVHISDSSYSPMFEKNTSLIATMNGGVRKGDIAIIALNNGQSIIVRFIKLSSHTVEIMPIKNDTTESIIISNKDILWTSRVLYKEVS